MVHQLAGDQVQRVPIDRCDRPHRVFTGSDEARVLREQRGAQPAARPVGGDDEVGARERLVVGAVDRDVGPHGAGGECRREHPVQPRPRCDHERGARRALERLLVADQQRAAEPVAQPGPGPQRVGERADLAAQTERIEGEDAVGRQPDPGPDLAHLRPPLQHRDPVACTMQRECRRESPESAADHHCAHDSPPQRL